MDVDAAIIVLYLHQHHRTCRVRVLDSYQVAVANRTCYEQNETLRWLYLMATIESKERCLRS